MQFQCCPATVLQNLLHNVADDSWNECKLQISVIVCSDIMGLYSDIGHRHLVVATNPSHFLRRLPANLCYITFGIYGAWILSVPEHRSGTVEIQGRGNRNQLTQQVVISYLIFITCHYEAQSDAHLIDGFVEFRKFT